MCSRSELDIMWNGIADLKPNTSWDSESPTCGRADYLRCDSCWSFHLGENIIT